MLKLILGIAVVFVMFHLLRAVLLMVNFTQEDFYMHVVSYVALPDIHHFGARFWTLLTYGWLPGRWDVIDFWAVVSNLIWVWWFATPVQMLIGNKQVIPIFFYSLIMGGIFYLAAQFLPGSLFVGRAVLMGPQAGILGMGIAALTLEPRYRYFIADRFSIPLWVAVTIFCVLVFIGEYNQPLMLFFLGGGALMGFLYIKMLRAGYRPGDWMTGIFEKMESMVTPKPQASWERHSKKRNEVLNKIHESKHSATQRRVDEILDKINQKGYNSLTAEEKNILMNASKGKQ